MSINKDELIKVAKEYPELRVEWTKENNCIFRGNLNVNYTEKDHSVLEDFLIEINVPSNYPQKVPTVFEKGDKIPTSYVHKYSDHSLCLGTDIEILIGCKGTLTIKFLIENYVIPYLFSYNYYARYKTFPFGDRSHNSMGLIEGYLVIFNVITKIDALFTLKTAIMKNYRGHKNCLCGSNKKIRNCHPVPKNILSLLEDKQNLKNQMENDFKIIQKELKKENARYRRKTKST